MFVIIREKKTGIVEEKLGPYGRKEALNILALMRGRIGSEYEATTSNKQSTRAAGVAAF